MVTFDLPGVYSEEVAPSGAPVKGVGVGTVALVGKFYKGVENVPERCGEWLQFVEKFGGLAIGSAAYDALWTFKQKCPALVVVRVKGTQANITIQDRQVTPADKMKVTAMIDGVFANYAVGPPKVGIQVIIADGTIANTFKATFKYYYEEKDVAQEYVETFDNLSIDTSATRYFKTIINAGSYMVEVEDLAPTNQTPPDHLPAIGTSDLAGGIEPDYTGTGVQEGIDILELDDDINIVITDKDDSSTRSLQITHCETQGDRQTVLNPSQYMTVAEIKALGDALDTDRAVITYPWRVAYDPIMKVARSFRPAGFRAGLMARINPHQSPSNKKEYAVDDLERQLSRTDLVSLQNSKISPTYWWGTRGVRTRNGINCSSNENLNQVFRRRMTDWIMESIDDHHGWAVSMLITTGNRDAVVGGITSWFRDLKGIEWIEGFYVSVTKDEEQLKAEKAARKFLVRYGVKLFQVADYIHFQAEIGPNVIVSTEGGA